MKNTIKIAIVAFALTLAAQSSNALDGVKCNLNINMKNYQVKIEKTGEVRKGSPRDPSVFANIYSVSPVGLKDFLYDIEYFASQDVDFKSQFIISPKNGELAPYAMAQGSAILVRFPAESDHVEIAVECK